MEIERICNNEKDSGIIPLAVVGASLILIVNALYVIFGPTITLKQDTGGYFSDAGLLIANEFSFTAYLENAKHTNSMYMLFVSIVALSRMLLGNYWYIGILVLNLTSIAMSVYFVVSILEKSTNSSATSCFAIILCLCSADFLIRSRLILSDTSYMFFSFCVYSLIVFAFGSEKFFKQICLFCVALIVTGCLFFYRPVNIVVGGFFIVAIFEFWIYTSFSSISLAKFVKINATVLVVISILVIMLIGAIMKDPSLWPTDFGYYYIERMSAFYKAGVTIHGRPVFIKRPDTYSNDVVNYVDYILLICKKTILFFQIAVSSHSISHKILKYSFYAPAYTFAFIGILFLFRKESGYSLKAWWAGWLAFQWIWLFTLYHSLTYIDYTWRYRLPCVPAFILLAGLGFYQTWERFIRPRRPLKSIL